MFQNKNKTLRASAPNSQRRSTVLPSRDKGRDAKRLSSVLNNPELIRDEHNPLRIDLWEAPGAQPLNPDQARTRALSPDLLRLARALSLPTNPVPFGSTGMLFGRIREVFQTYVQLSEGVPELLAAFVISTWFADCTPTVPLLVIYGSSMDVQPVLRILQRLCRRGLVVAGATASALSSRITQLMPTLLLSHPHINERLIGLVYASSSPGQVVLVHGGPRQILYAKAISVDSDDFPEDLARMALRVTVDPMVQPPRLTEPILRQLENEFQNRLFAYRLAVGEKVATSDFDVSDFVRETRLLARALGSCIVDDAEVQRKVVDLLAVQDRENRIARSSDVRCVVIEAVLFRKREGKKLKFLVGEIAETVNNLLQSRDEPTKLTERKIGEELKRLGFRKRRQGPGVYLVLDADNQQLVDRLARQYNVLSVQFADERPPDNNGLASP